MIRRQQPMKKQYSKLETFGSIFISIVMCLVVLFVPLSLISVINTTSNTNKEDVIKQEMIKYTKELSQPIMGYASKGSRGDDDSRKVLVSPVVFVCCQPLVGYEGNKGQLSRRLPDWYGPNYSQSVVPVQVQYMNAPCFTFEEHLHGNPIEKTTSGGNSNSDGEKMDWIVDTSKEFPLYHVNLFQQRVHEIYSLGGIVLAEGNCKIPRAEISNIYLEALLDYSLQNASPSGVSSDDVSTTITTAAAAINNSSNNNNNTIRLIDERIIDKFKLQNKKLLRQTLVKYGYEKYVPKQYYNISEILLSKSTTSSSSSSSNSISYPIVLKREKAEGGVGTYIVHSQEELKQRLKDDEYYDSLGMNHRKSRHRTYNSAWLLEEYLPGTTQELIVYLRPRGLKKQRNTASNKAKDFTTYFWCGSHSNTRWNGKHGEFVKGYANIRGTVTTPTNCSQHDELLELIDTVLTKEDIYGTGCINYKYGTTSINDDGNIPVPKVHDWNLRTCATMSDYNKGVVFIDLINQIPKRGSSDYSRKVNAGLLDLFT